eukprot:TRINITY_DN920_c0_g1_i1.p1 TRINITY_DN920_c0_g1~~TRINITY_DN920_c0_g1_i1.p1  ORF type:complete len:395 (+),score=77.60 TRINITY_DN920_c0_g1_i1:1309-2493(+)
MSRLSDKQKIEKEKAKKRKKAASYIEKHYIKESYSEESIHEDECGCWRGCCGDSVEGWCRLRDGIYDFVNDENSSVGAAIYSAVNFVVIIESIIVFVIISEPEHWVEPDPIFYAIEVFNIVFFTIDFMIKLLFTRENRLSWFFQFFNLVDFLAIAPFYIELLFSFIEGISGLAVLRVLRLLRIVRVLKALKFIDDIGLVMKATLRSGSAFLMLIFSIALMTALFGTLIFYAEQTRSVFNETELVWYYDNGDKSPYQSITIGFWWAVTTITTVGYGDMSPYTEVGRLTASLLMICGILTLVFPLTIIGSNFQEVYSDAHTETLDKYINQRKTNPKRLRKKRDVMGMIVSLDVELKRVSATLSKLRDDMTGITAIYDDVQEIAGMLAQEYEDVYGQ